MNEEELNKDSFFEFHFPHELVGVEFFLCVLHLHSEEAITNFGGFQGPFSKAEKLSSLSLSLFLL